MVTHLVPGCRLTYSTLFMATTLGTQVDVNFTMAFAIQTKVSVCKQNFQRDEAVCT